jgi:glycosyltransferase involved in cell wall biosynthesis
MHQPPPKHLVAPAPAANDAWTEIPRAVNLPQDVDRRDVELHMLRAQLAAAQRERDLVLHSTIWRATRPLRFVADAVPFGLRRLARRALGRRAREAPNLPDVAETPAAPPFHGVRDEDYAVWIAQCDTLSPSDRVRIRAHIARLAHPALISVVMPAYETPEEYLREAIDSVRNQLYPHWELCIADDGSPSDVVARVVREAAADPRIKFVRCANSGHIAAATNAALAIASGDFVALMDHDDLLAERALYEIAVEIAAHPDADLIYSDEDHIDSAGRRTLPYFKPAWNIDLMLGHNVVSHLGVYRHSKIREIGGLREGFAGSQDYDLSLRVIAATTPERIRHIPAVLYHWRQFEESFSKSRREACASSARRAVADFLAAQGLADRTEVTSVPSTPDWLRVRWTLPDVPPRVSLIVPTRDRAELLQRCVEGLLNRTDYPDIELIIVDNDSGERQTLALLERLRADKRVRILPFAGAFNYSAINNAAAAIATGEVLVLINNDIDVIGGDWLREMVGHALRPDVGAVGARLLYPDGTIQHAGVVLGVCPYDGGPGVAGHVGLGTSPAEPGYFGQSVLTREFAAVTGACLAVRKSEFDAVGGLDAEHLAVAFNDIDLCLRLRARGLRIVWTPFAELYHLESASRGDDIGPEKVERFKAEYRTMRERWGAVLDEDPFYNVNFSRNDATFRLAAPARRGKPWLRA